jgi:hypothetical protein
MSHERRRAREAREAAAVVEAERAAAEQRRRPTSRSGPGPRTTARKGAATAKRAPRSERRTVYRQRRFPPLPWRLKAALALGWLTVVLLGAYLSPSWLGRLGIVVIATFCLPLIVVIVRDPTRRTPR